MTVLVIDGQGGKMGAAIVAQIKAKTKARIMAVGTNSIATAAMLKAGADAGATGENPVVVNAREADFIVGPMGIVIADSLHGEITPAMAVAVGQCLGKRILIPVNRCNTAITGAAALTLGEYVSIAADMIAADEA